MLDIGNKSSRDVFRYFEEISKIPRGSGNENGISDYLVSFAKSKGLGFKRDEALNVLIEKPATKGYENAPTVIIQGHMDMVCDKVSTSSHDFSKDPIELRIDGDMIYANDTTLGADDGIAMAFSLAMLDSASIPHPALKVLVTTGEETGLNGAAALEAGYLDGDMLINMDSEEEGVLLLSCAGGLRVKHNMPAQWEKTDPGHISYRIVVRGLKGGHSGADIEKSRGNAIKLLGRLLNSILKELDMLFVEINGGSKMNAIPREAEAVVLVKPGDENRLAAIVNECGKIFKNELFISDKDVEVDASKLENNFVKALSEDTTEKIISLLMVIPNGIQTMSTKVEGLVESSTNLGVVSTTEKLIVFESALRSNTGSLKYHILNQMIAIADILEIKLSMDSDYPEWEYSVDSRLREICKKVYNDMYGQDIKLQAIHAGLECGLFKQKNPRLDMVSMGPDMFDVHTPREHISISSIERTWEYLLALLKEIR